jgi:hypothetical protein
LPRDLDLQYIAEDAQQRDFAGGDPRIRANYYRLGDSLVYKRAFMRLD